MISAHASASEFKQYPHTNTHKYKKTYLIYDYVFYK